MRRFRIYDKLKEISALDSTLPGQSLLEIISDKRILLERHRGVSKYTREQVCVKCDYGIVIINGFDLYIKNMSFDQLLVTGRIDSVQMCRCDPK